MQLFLMLRVLRPLLASVGGTKTTRRTLLDRCHDQLRALPLHLRRAVRIDHGDDIRRCVIGMRPSIGGG